jgi:hypothetical protein
MGYYEDEFCKIKIVKNKFLDKFNITYSYSDNKIQIKRIDAYEGWGQNLKIIFINKLTMDESIIEVGSCDENVKELFYEINNKLADHIHYEDDIYKIFYISENYNDVFKIDYSVIYKKIIIMRLDDTEGWGQKLKLKIINKNTLQEKILLVGSSKFNSVEIHYELNKESSDISYNYYENNNYIVKINQFKNNNYPDLFIFQFYEETQTIFIKRVDKNEGWGQKLIIDIYDKLSEHNYKIYIGDSERNELYKKLDLRIRKAYVSLTTIPSRIKLPDFESNVINFIENQTYNIEAFFIVVAKEYRRFKDTISNDIINRLKLIHMVIIIELDQDFGPASKYLGPLLTYYDILENNILVIIDDDRLYNKNLVSNMMIGYHSFPNNKFLSGEWNRYFNKDYKIMNDDELEIYKYQEKNNYNFYYGNGLGGFFGFALKVEQLNEFIMYNINILNRIDKSFYHDEGIILGYLKYKEENIIYLKHRGCNFIEKEMVDALCHAGYVNRSKLEKEILQITNLEHLL